MRLYNGCPDSQLKAVWDNRQRLRDRVTAIDPQARCVYFPMEGLYQVWSNAKPVSDSWGSAELAMEEFLAGAE